MDKDYWPIENKCWFWICNIAELKHEISHLRIGEQYRLRKDCLCEVIADINTSYQLAQSDNVLAPTSPAHLGPNGIYIFTKAFDMSASSEGDDNSGREIPFPVGRLLHGCVVDQPFEFIYLQRIGVDDSKFKLNFEGPDVVDVLRKYIV